MAKIKTYRATECQLSQYIKQRTDSEKTDCCVLGSMIHASKGRENGAKAGPVSIRVADWQPGRKGGETTLVG